MNLDAIFSFALSALTAIGGFIHFDPSVTALFHTISIDLALIGTALHLDGK